MLLRTLGVAAVLTILAGPVLAFQCPLDVKKIDAALAANTTLSAADRVMVNELRDKGDTQHKAGQHKDAVETLAKAKDVLGIQ